MSAATMEVWTWFASPGAALLAGLSALAVLVLRKKHRDVTGAFSTPRIVAVMSSGAAFYVLAILTVGSFIFGIPISETIHDGFGEQRMAWLFALIATNLALSLWDEFR